MFGGEKLEWEEEKYLQGAKNLFLRRRIFLFFIFGWGAFLLFLLADKKFLRTSSYFDVVYSYCVISRINECGSAQPS